MKETALSIALLAAASAAAAQLVFTDTTAQLGIGDVEHHHFGIAVVDADQDGWVDVYYENGNGDPISGPPPPSGVCPEGGVTDPDPLNDNVFFLNQGDGMYTRDVAPAVGLADPWNAMRHVWGDYDNDGLRDLFSHNFLLSSLYRQIAPMQFADVSDGVGARVCITKGTGASWVDVNNDGWLDLYACEYDAGRSAVEHVNYLLLSDGSGGFIDVTRSAGLLPDNPMGIAFADYDNDSDQDFFTSNSHEAPSRLYRNDGPGPGGVPQFTDVGRESSVAVRGEPNRGFGTAWGDYNNDGNLDLLFIRENDSHLFRNMGPGRGWTFTDVSAQLGLAGLGLFQGGNFADLNNDGWLDLFLADANPDEGANRLFLNGGDPDLDGDVSWQEVAAAVGLDLPAYDQRGFIPADYDNDGDLDVFIWNRSLGDPNMVFRNDTPPAGWMQFKLTGTASNRDAVGARIQVRAQLRAGGPMVSQIREVVAGTGFFSDIPRIQHFGLGSAQRAWARIVWPSGQVETLGWLEANQRIEVVEPAG